MLGFDLAQFFLGAQVDGTETFAIAAQLFQIGLDVADGRKFGLGRDLRKCRDTVRFDFEHVADFALDVFETALGAFHTLFGAGAGFTRSGQRIERGARSSVGFRHRGFRRSQCIGGGAAIGFGVFDFADQRAALLGEYLRRVFKFGALGLDLDDAGFDGRDLRRGIFLAALPFVAFGHDCLHAPVGEFGFAGQCLRFGANLRRETAVAVHVGTHGGEAFFVLSAGGQFAQSGDSAFVRAVGFGAVGGQACAAFVERGAARRVAVDLAFGGCVAFSRRIGFTLGVACGFTRSTFSGGCGLEFSVCRLQSLTLGYCIGARLFDFGFDILEACAFGQPPRCTGRSMSRCDETVPTPEIAFARHQPLTGLQLRNELRATLAADDADLRQTPRQFRWSHHMLGQRLDACR